LIFFLQSLDIGVGAIRLAERNKLSNQLEFLICH